MSIVLDSSMCLAWCIEDGLTPEVLAVIERVIEDGAWVPPLWRYEIGNGLLVAQRRRRIDTDRRLALLAALADFSIMEELNVAIAPRDP